MSEAHEVNLEPELLEMFRKLKQRDRWVVIEVMRWMLGESNANPVDQDSED